MAKIVVTGGAGFIGSHIVDAFLAEKHQVLVIDNLSSGSRKNLSGAVKLYELDVRSPEARAVLGREKPDAVVHAAAQISVRESMADPLFDVEVNVAGIVNLLCGCRSADKPYFIFLSTGGAIYGEQNAFPAPETHAVRPASIYGLSKRVSEMYLDFWHREFGLNFAALRLSNVYGPRQNPHGEAGVVAIFNQCLLTGRTPVIYGSGEQTRDFVFVADVACAAYLVFSRRIQGTYNIGTGRETSVNELYKLIAASQSSGVAPQYAPAKEGEQMRSSIDAGLAERTFGWKPQVSLEQGLKITAEWFREQRV